MQSFTANQIVAHNLRRLREDAGLSQRQLAALVTQHGIDWSTFTVSDAELAVRPDRQGRRFTPDELVLLSTLFFVTPNTLLLPPTARELGGESVRIEVGNLEMSREEYVTDVLLMAGGVRSRNWDELLANVDTDE